MGSGDSKTVIIGVLGALVGVQMLLLVGVTAGWIVTCYSNNVNKNMATDSTATIR